MQMEIDFDSPPAQSHSPTSVAAAESVAETSETLRFRVFRMIVAREAEGMTDAEIIDAIGGNPNGIRPRRIELVKCGWIRDSGRTRATASGRQAVVWEAV